MPTVAQRARVALALALLSGFAPSYGQDLLQVWQLAQQRDPLYAAARASRNADQEIVPQARAQLLPYVQANVLGDLNDSRRVSGLDNSSSHRRGAWALTLIQPIIDFGKWDRLQQSEFVAASANIALQQAYQSLILRTAQAYFDVLAAQDSLRAFRAQKSAVATQLRAAQQSFELGSTTIADTYEAQARLDLLNANELQAQNNLQVAQDLLTQIIAERPAALAELAANTTLPAPAPNRLSDWTDQSVQASFEVARAQLATKIVEKNIDIAKSGHKPVLELQAQTSSASNRGIYGADKGGPRSLDTTIGLQLSIPLFAGGGISSQVREQASRLQQARYDLEASKRQAVQSTQRYFSGVTSGLAQVQALQAAEKSSLASLNANQTGYEVGVRINIDVLNAQQQLYETQRALSRALYDTLMNSLKLKASSGILNEADIVAINHLLSPAPTPKS
jgi:outer membrane protein